MRHLDKVPMGYRRMGNGWLTPEKTPQRSELNRLKAKNIELKDRLAQLEEAVAALTAKKAKKQNG